jgi:hypothetical protein
MTRDGADLAERADFAGFAGLDERRDAARLGAGHAHRNCAIEMPRFLGCSAGCDQDAGHKGRADQSLQSRQCRLPGRDQEVYPRE